MMTFHVFVCSACAGIHREMNHKVKGISMCVFTDDELKLLTDNGNAVSEPPLPRRSPFTLCVGPARKTDEKLESEKQPRSRQDRQHEDEGVLASQVR